jgi:hypothetical protein
MPDFGHETGGKSSIFIEIVAAAIFGLPSLKAVIHGTRLFDIFIAESRP